MLSHSENCSSSFSNSNVILEHKACIFSATHSAIYVKTWHNRLGHLPLYKLRRLSLVNYSDEKGSIDSCNSCPQARQHKKSFSHSQRRTRNFLFNSYRDLAIYHTQIHQGYR